MKNGITNLHAGWTHNPNASLGQAHVVMERKSDGSPKLACGQPSYAMEPLAFTLEPKRKVCEVCANYLRDELLRHIVSAFPEGSKINEAQAVGYMTAFVRHARQVVP